MCPKFEAKWLEEEEDYRDRVAQAWAEAMEAGVDSIVEIQKKVLRDLHD